MHSVDAPGRNAGADAYDRRAKLTHTARAHHRPTSAGYPAAGGQDLASCTGRPHRGPGPWRAMGVSGDRRCDRAADRPEALRRTASSTEMTNP